MPADIEMPAESKRNTHITEANAQKIQLKELRQVPSYMFDEVMMGTYERGQSVEEFFYGFARFEQGDFILSRDDFVRAMSQLPIELGSN
jgi:hypothetical protein